MKKKDDLAGAIEARRSAIAVLMEIQEHPTLAHDSAETLLRLFDNFARLAGELREANRDDEARQAWVKCFEFGRLAAYQSSAGDTRNQLAWPMVTCPYRELNKPIKAIKFAQQAVAVEPKNSNFWNTLATALYRAGQLDKTLVAFDPSQELGDGGSAHDWYFRAMIHHKLNDKKQTQFWLRRAIRWHESKAPVDNELKRFRDEAISTIK